MRIHLIAIGGAVMHNLALELHAQGNQVSGSDDEIYDPARTRLEAAGLLPEQVGWDENLIDTTIDLIILGMHAKLDNPELVKAQRLGLKIQSFPEFIASYVAEKTKIVVCGSHGKTTTTAMIMHVLKDCKVKFDYMVGGLIEGFERMVGLHSDSKIAVLEGDEYLSSRLDPKSKMLHYRGDIIILTGIAWDHINVFPSFEKYLDPFRNLVRQMKPGGVLIHFDDKEERSIAQLNQSIEIQPYSSLKVDREKVVLEGQVYPVQIFGDHNMANMNAARLACASIGISSDDFFRSIGRFEGVGKRLEKINDDPLIYRDFAHAPSKVAASVDAMSHKWPDSRLLVIVELHTYSSLNKDFIPHYKGSLEGASKAIVFYDPKAVRLKRLEELDPAYIHDCFNHSNLTVINKLDDLEVRIRKEIKQADVSLVMSSGNLAGIDLVNL